MMNKQLIIALLAGILLLGGCDKFSIGKGGGKFIIPFDFPSKKADTAK